ncbi:hypothetical protein HPB49_002280 [Dermacentor silvarum]|uniref:Uncharacterized protein n=1 Tax=Dermacentor silvarum TaxID=543639 RepID=A0ACB8DMI0_DERSI|nr:hypothetical protein HPB49_002280 [Dermacentor silvarum]
MYAATAPKRHRRRKLKLKLSFGSASNGPNNLPSNMKPSLPELFALHTLKQKHNEGERRCGVARNAREAATSKPYVKEFLQENGPSQEHDLLKALSPSKAQQIIEVYCTLTGLLDRYPRFLALHEHLCSSIYYQHTDDQAGECDCSPLVHGGACTGSSLASTTASGRQYAVARDDESRSAHGPAVNGDDREQEKHRMKNGWIQVPSPPRCESRALQAVLQTCDAEAQTHGLDPARFTELQSKPIKCDAETAELKERLRTLQESHVLEAEQLRVKIEKLRKETPRATTAECGGGNEQPPRHERAEAHWHEWGGRPSNSAASTATTASEVSTPSSQAPVHVVQSRRGLYEGQGGASDLQNSVTGALPSVSGQLKDMSTAPATKRHRRRKLKSKLSFGSASSGPSNLPTNMKPSLPELFALHTSKQKPNEGERPCEVARNARVAATSKPNVKGCLKAEPFLRV